MKICFSSMPAVEGIRLVWSVCLPVNEHCHGFKIIRGHLGGVVQIFANEILLGGNPPNEILIFGGMNVQI